MQRNNTIDSNETKDRHNQARQADNNRSPPLDKPKLDILDDKSKYLQNKKRQEIEELQNQLQRERERYLQKQKDQRDQVDELRAKHETEMRQIEKSYNSTLDLLIAENDKIMSSSLAEAIHTEATKISSIHKAELEQKQKLHEE